MSLQIKTRSNPWPIAIIVYLVLFFAFTVAIVGYISHQKMDLVRGDYYDDEIRYQEQLDRINQTQAIKDQVVIGYDNARELITINLPAPRPKHQPEGRIRLYRPSDESLDQNVQLVLNAAGCQSLDAKNLRSGLWRVRIYWTVDGHDYYFGQSIVIGKKTPQPV